ARPELAREVEEESPSLPGAPPGGRETSVASPSDARPQYVTRMPGPGWRPLLAAVGMAGFFLLLTVKLVAPAVLSGIVMIVACFIWAWKLDHGPEIPSVEIGAGVRLPTYMAGPLSHAWWAMVVLIIV